MTYLAQGNNWRPTRIRPRDVTPAVLRLRDGRRTPGKLQTFSLTGGLLCLSKPLDLGCRVKLMFLTHTGLVFGSAEMLSPVSRTEQPFRFLALDADDQNRLRAAIQSSTHRSTDEKEWIEKYRTTLNRRPPRRRLFRMLLLAAITLGTLGLGSAIYVLGIHLVNW